MKISVFGIGYVGAVTAACLSNSGHEVIAVDVNDGKVAAINNGSQLPIVEKDLDTMLGKARETGALSATLSLEDAVLNSEMSLICVGTPSDAQGALDISHVKNLCGDIARILKQKDAWHTVVVRSTVLPGTLVDVIKPLMEKLSGKKAGQDFGLGNNPEFLRESTAVHDYFNPSQIVVGACDEATAQKIMSLYDGIESQRFITDPGISEAVKYISNSWRATKISFANEMGNILKRLNVDSHAAMDIFTYDRMLNMGPAFLKPGFAFGGSCLPKDVRALRASANEKGLKTPFFDGVMTANRAQVERARKLIDAMGVRKILLLGLSFKPYTNDVRESPLLDLALQLLEEGYDLSIIDPCVMDNVRLTGMPELDERVKSRLQDMTVMPSGTELIVIGHGHKDFQIILDTAEEHIPIFDLVRYDKELESRPAYTGLAW